MLGRGAGGRGEPGAQEPPHPFRWPHAQPKVRNPVPAGAASGGDSGGDSGGPRPFSTLRHRPHVSSFVSPPTSRPEGGRHEEEAAAVHRALQVAAELPEPRLRVLRTGVCRAREPGTSGAPRTGPGDTSEPGRTRLPKERSRPVLTRVFFSSTSEVTACR